MAVKLKFVCPCGSGGTGKSSRQMAPPLRRNSSMGSQNSSNLARYFSIAFFIFAATTYLVFSLDMLMVPEDEPVTLMPRRRTEAEESSSANLRSTSKNNDMFSVNAITIETENSSPSLREDRSLSNSNLVTMEDEDLEAMNVERQHRSSAEIDMAMLQQRLSSQQQQQMANTEDIEEDDEFADGLNSIGLAMQQAGGPAAAADKSSNIDPDTQSNSNNQASLSSPIILPNQASSQAMTDEDEPPQPIEEEEDDDDLTDPILATNRPMDTSLSNHGDAYSHNAGAGGADSSDSAGIPLPGVTNVGDWRRMHTCKYGRSEKSATLAYGTWVWRHKKGAVLHDDYAKTPTDSKLRHLKYALSLVNDKTMDLKNVIGAASEAGYTLCKIDFETSMIIAWQPRLRGDALFFTRHPIISSGEDEPKISTPKQGPSVTNLVIEVPHALYDHTLHQGLHVFSETRARALILSESHRCSRSLANKCTGNDGEPIRNLCTSSKSAAVYHNSDVAHAVQTTFQAVHEQLSEDNPAALIASLHATKSEEFIVSDGTSNQVAPNSPILKFAHRLASNLPESMVHLCNEFSNGLSSLGEPNLVDVSDDKRHICGATNVQGRHVNGAQDACRAKVRRNGQELKATGRFLHIEQPVNLVLPIDSKTTKPVMSKPLSDAILAALDAWKLQNPLGATAAKTVRE